MINTKKAIIFIDKQKLVGTVVNCRNFKLSDTAEVGWDENTFELSLGKIIENLKYKRVRILLDDTFSYVIRLKVPIGMNKAEERIFISQKISEKIPELLNDRDWDYKEINFNLTSKNGAEENVKDVLVFSPVKYLLDLLSKVVDRTGIEIEAIEPVEIAITRNTNPIIGLALKEDLNREDNEQLNINIIKSKKEMDLKDIIALENSETPVETLEAEDTTKSEIDVLPKKINKYFYLVIAAVLAISLILAAVYLFVIKNQNKSTKETQTVETQTPTVVVTNSPSPTEVQINKAVFKIEVLNGSGVSGEAAFVSNLLKGVGFKDIKTGDAPSKNFPQTQIESKPEIPFDVIEEIKTTLGNDFNVATRSAILDGSEFDIIITTGLRK